MKGAVLRFGALTPAQKSAQARKAAYAKWDRRREAEDAPAIRGKLNKLRGTREQLLAAVLDNAKAGAAGKPVKGATELAAIRAGLSELRMEIPLVEAKLLQAPPIPLKQPVPIAVPVSRVQHSPLGAHLAEEVLNGTIAAD